MKKKHDEPVTEESALAALRTVKANLVGEATDMKAAREAQRTISAYIRQREAEVKREAKKLGIKVSREPSKAL